MNLTVEDRVKEGLSSQSIAIMHAATLTMGQTEVYMGTVTLNPGPLAALTIVPNAAT